MQISIQTSIHDLFNPSPVLSPTHKSASHTSREIRVRPICAPHVEELHREADCDTVQGLAKGAVAGVPSVVLTPSTVMALIGFVLVRKLFVRKYLRENPLISDPTQQGEN